ncbi:MAG: Nramp family divalent metal transporter [Parachlamydiaceae bacterium]
MLKKAHKLWRTLGPGFITGASDDDPSGIATYSQAGARFGMQTLWLAWATLPLMIVVLEMFARLSLATSKGLASNLRDHYPPYFIYLVVILTFPAIIFNIGADLAAMDAVARLLFPQAPQGVFSFGFTAILIYMLIFLSYDRVAAILKWLCLVLVVYFVVPFLVQQDWGAVLRAVVVPEIEWSHDYLYIVVAIIGTTISPYLFFWQSAMSLEHKQHRKLWIRRDAEMREMKLDINVGMVISNLVMFFIILTTASVLFPAGLRDIATLEEAAAALKPLAGNYAYILFALGVFGTGLLAIPVLGGSIAYFISDMFDLDGGIDKHWRKAKRFYSIMIGTLVLGFLLSLIPIQPVQFLIYTAVGYGITTPLLIGLVLHMCNNPKVVRHYTNNLLANILGFITLVLTGTAAIALIFMTLF